MSLRDGVAADAVVVGAGVVGLACGAALAAAGWRVLVLERGDRIGAETSSRNSQVIHAGLYYPDGSLKAECCVRGRELLYARCARLGIPHRQIGKLVVATADGEIPTLERIQAQARRNGVAEIEGVNVMGWFDEMIHRGLPHHMLIARGHHRARLKRFARQVGIDWIEY